MELYVHRYWTKVLLSRGVVHKERPKKDTCYPTPPFVCLWLIPSCPLRADVQHITLDTDLWYGIWPNPSLLFTESFMDVPYVTGSQKMINIVMIKPRILQPIN